jgi:peptidoglycan/LPS O-acetylase OafA/YrhL
MGLDGFALVLVLASFGIAFVVARVVAKRVRAKRDAAQVQQAERALAQQSRQVRRAAARQKKG